MMFKTSLPLASIVLLLTSCSSFNNLFESKSSVIANTAADKIQRSTLLDNANARFNQTENMVSKQGNKMASAPQEVSISRSSIPSSVFEIASTALESFMPMQFKYAIMMNATVEKLTNISLYKTIDEWFGTRYRFGGTTRRGIDCSAFMQVLGQYVFGWVLPRTAREQYGIMDKIKREDIQEGDFVYFHTGRRGVSHVGMCLQNNKFVHASTSKGVVISDLDDTYWDSKIIGFRRMKDEEATALRD
ncbi:MAG: NlpC/P60 family protein [Bacteroidota bacterium]